MKNSTGERFFLAMGLVLLAIVVAGFLPPAFARPGGIASIPALLHLHGAVFVSWFGLFCLQAYLPGAGNLRLHKRLGATSLLLAVAMLVLAYFVIRAAYARPDWNIAGLPRATSVMFPFTDMVNFTIVYGLALIHRHNATAHKRLMLLAGILMIDPAVARLTITLGAPAPVIVLLEVALFVVLFVYDIRRRGRPSWTSVLGFCLYALALAAKLTIAQQPAWHTFVESVFSA